MALKLKLILLSTLLVAFVSTQLYAQPVKFYSSIGGGYGAYLHMDSNDGYTTLGRLGVGAEFYELKRCRFGAELGIQTGNRMHLQSGVVAALGPGTTAMSIYIKPPVDLLASMKTQLTPDFFLATKLGLVFISEQAEYNAISNTTQTIPEFQLGIGYDYSYTSRFILSYQRMFGQHVTLSDVDYDEGTAELNGVPIFQAALFTIEVDIV